MKKIFLGIFSVLKWAAVIIGLPFVIWLCYIAVVSFQPFSKDVSTKDLDFKLKLKEIQQSGKQPNILIILADDLGYGDLSCYGSKSIKTPNIDKIAQNGVSFTNHYTSASICSPSRASLMTGRYAIRSGFTSVIPPTDWDFTKKVFVRMGKTMNDVGASDHGKESFYNGLPHKEITIAQALKQKGYATGITGKWHLGDMKDHPEFNPMHYGFDDYMGINAANEEYPVALFDKYKLVKDNIREDQEEFTQIFAERAIQFITQNKDKPFFYYLSFTAPHIPLVPSKNFRGKSNGGIFGDVVEEMDFYIGKVMQSLEEQGLADNTIILFSSDNGSWYQGSTGGLRGGKGQIYEGSFKVPFMVSWKGHTPPNTTCDATVMNFDIFPTLLNIVGLENPQDRIIDGKNILDLWTGKSKESPHDKLFFYHYDQPEAVWVKNDWKYYSNPSHYVWPTPVDRVGTVTEKMTHEFFGDRSSNLYNLKLDPTESYNLSEHYPARIDSMSKLLMSWKAEMANNTEGWIK